MNTQLWIVVRQVPDTPAELLAAFADRIMAVAAAAELGKGHFAAPCPTADIWSVVHTWSCRAEVSGGTVTELPPHQLLGASRLVLPGETAPSVESVIVDQDAAELESAVHGRTVAYVTAHAASAQRAAELAHERAWELAAEQRAAE
ncbi:hypothetical protein [Actinokineospora sp.]|uniref:hypothetical protein n=1 Tax=Actinokineospora sp. TaxID=1872133 RepID=UPI003D6AA919